MKNWQISEDGADDRHQHIVVLPRRVDRNSRSLPFDALRSHNWSYRSHGYFKDSDDSFNHAQILSTIDGIAISSEVPRKRSAPVTCQTSVSSSSVSIRSPSKVEVYPSILNQNNNPACSNLREGRIIWQWASLTYRKGVVLGV